MSSRIFIAQRLLLPKKLRNSLWRGIIWHMIYTQMKCVLRKKRRRYIRGNGHTSWFRDGNFLSKRGKNFRILCKPSLKIESLGPHGLKWPCSIKLFNKSMKCGMPTNMHITLLLCKKNALLRLPKHS